MDTKPTVICQNCKWYSLVRAGHLEFDYCLHPSLKIIEYSHVDGSGRINWFRESTNCLMNLNGNCEKFEARERGGTLHEFIRRVILGWKL